MSRSARERLAAEQAALAAALVADAPVPPGFDEAAVAAARALLERKHASDATRAQARAGGDTSSALRALGRAFARPSALERLLSRWRRG